MVGRSALGQDRQGVLRRRVEPLPETRRDLGTASRQPCRPFIPSIGIHQKFTRSRYIAFPMNLAMSLLIGILSVATATMWFVAFALWLRSNAGRSTPEPQHRQADDQRALT
jgi:hypothetical protein